MLYKNLDLNLLYYPFSLSDVIAFPEPAFGKANENYYNARSRFYYVLRVLHLQLRSVIYTYQ